MWTRSSWWTASNWWRAWWTGPARSSSQTLDRVLRVVARGSAVLALGLSLRAVRVVNRRPGLGLEASRRTAQRAAGRRRTGPPARGGTLRVMPRGPRLTVKVRAGRLAVGAADRLVEVGGADSTLAVDGQERTVVVEKSKRKL